MGYKHLDSEALLRAAYGVAGNAEAEHLRKCAACAAAAEVLDAQRVAVASSSAVEDLPEAFWQRQRRQILAGIEQRASFAYGQFAVALSLTIVLALAVLSAGGGIRQTRDTASHESRVALQAAEDEQLLRDVTLIVNRIEPRALEPAILLVPNESNKEVRQP